MTKNDKVRMLFLVGLVSALASTNVYLLVPNLEVIGHEMNVNNFYLGILAGGYLISFGIASLIWGYINDRFNVNRKKLFSFSMIISSVSTFFTALSFDPISLLLSRIIAAIFISSILPISFSVIADLFYIEERVSAFSVWIVLMNIGSAAGYTLSLFSEKFFHWRTALVIDAVILLISIIFIIFLRNPKRGEAEKILEEIFNKGLLYSFRFDANNIKALFNRKTNIVVISQVLLSNVAWGAFAVWSLQFLVSEVNLDKLVATIIIGVLLFFEIFSVFFARYIDKKSSNNTNFKLNFAALGRSLQMSSTILFFTAILLFLPTIHSTGFLNQLIETLNAIIGNAVILLTFVLAIIGHFLGYLSKPISGSVFSETNLPEERSVIIALMSIFELLGRGIGSIIVGSIAQITSKIFIGLNIAFMFWGFASIAWILAKKYYSQDVKKLLKLLEERKIELLRFSTID